DGRRLDRRLATVHIVYSIRRARGEPGDEAIRGPLAVAELKGHARIGCGLRVAPLPETCGGGVRASSERPTELALEVVMEHDGAGGGLHAEQLSDATREVVQRTVLVSLDVHQRTDTRG